MYSEKLSYFLEFLRIAQSDYSIACQIEKEKTEETEDIKHYLEFCSVDYYEYAKLAKAFSEVRQQRRQAKNRRLQLQPVVDWISQNGQVIKGLERLLGTVRQEEKAQEKRQYKPKSNILDKTLQREVGRFGNTQKYD